MSTIDVNNNNPLSCSTNSERSYQHRARGHLNEEASVASLTSIVDELDQSRESEPDGETLGTEDSTHIVQTVA